MVIFGSLMYLIEGPEYGFTTLNASVYWAIVTITTVGYGDITPHTPLGRILASILILIGYSIIAIPTGLITTHMTSALNRRRQQRLCPQCQQGDHDDNARFCHAEVSWRRKKSLPGVPRQAFYWMLKVIHATEYGTAYDLSRGTAERGRRYH